MKDFFKGLGKMLWRHKLLSLICFTAFIIIVILLYIFASIFVGSNGKYGHRLDGIKAVELSKKELSSISDSINENDTVKNSSVRVEGKIVYIDIDFKESANKDKAKDISKSVLDEFSDKEKDFYDFEFVLSQEGKKGFKLTGTKSPKNKTISWIKS